MRTAILAAALLAGTSVLVTASQSALSAGVQERQGRLQVALDEWRASIQAPGASLGVVTRDGSIHALASGMADRTAGRRLSPNDLLMAGSTGKTFFAAVALQLIEAGRLDLDAHIS